MSAKQSPSNVARRKAPRRELGKTIVGSCAAVAAIVGLAVLSNLFSTFAATNSRTSASVQEDVRIGHVILWANRHQCKKLKFDNTNGRFRDDPSPRENEILVGNNGVAAPVGTVRRLDAISKSFLGRL